MIISTSKIERILAERLLTQKAFAESSGLSRQSISTILRRGTCAPITAGKLAQALGVTVEDLQEEQ